MLVEFLQTRRGISFPHMFRMKEYPQDVLPLYAQGHSLCTYLIGQKGKHEFMKYLATGLKSQDWTAATEQHYGYRGLGELQNSWLDWVQKGWPGADYGETSIAMRLASGRTGKGNGKDGGGKDNGFVYRGQSPESAGSSRPSGGSHMAPVRTAGAVSEATRPSAPRAPSAASSAAGEMTPGHTPSGDSSGWYAPRRSAETHVGESLAQAPRGETRPREETQPTEGLAALSRYERTGSLALADEFPGKHLPDVAPQAAPPRPGSTAAPMARLPTRPAFVPAYPTGMMPCFGGS
jgi:hypothetical protein